MIAPIDGRIGELKVKLGNLVGDNGDTELVNLQQLDPMGLDLRPAARNLPIATALQAKGGIPVNVAVEGERPHPHVGKTLFVDNQVDTQTSTFLVRADIPNPDGAILPGQYIKGTAVIGEYVDAIVVPEQAVLEGQEGPRVYVVDAASKVQVKKVRPGRRLPGPARARVGPGRRRAGDRRGASARPPGSNCQGDGRTSEPVSEHRPGDLQRRSAFQQQGLAAAGPRASEPTRAVRQKRRTATRQDRARYSQVGPGSRRQA